MFITSKYYFFFKFGCVKILRYLLNKYLRDDYYFLMYCARYVHVKLMSFSIT